MADDIDIVSDLNDGTSVDTTVPAETGDAAHGNDAVSVNNQNATREPQTTAKVVGETKPVGEKPASIRDLISSALKDEGATPDGAQQDGRPRNPDGTFAAKTPEEIAAAAPVVDPNAPKPAPAVAAPVGIDPTVFASLPAETQAQLARTMEDVSTQQKRFASLAPIEQLITPRIDAWALNGMQPAQALHQLLALSDFAGKDPGGFIKYIAQNNGVDLEALVLGLTDEPVDPKVAALEKELNELKGWKDGQTQSQQQAQHRAVVDNVLAFADEKGQDGQVLRPHLSELGESWLPYISMVKAQNPNWTHAQVLQQAYENACWNNASVRGKLQSTADAAATADRLRKEAERVAAARSANVSVRTGAPSAAPVAPNEANRSVRDTIRAAMAAGT